MLPKSQLETEVMVAQPQQLRYLSYHRLALTPNQQSALLTGFSSPPAFMESALSAKYFPRVIT